MRHGEGEDGRGDELNEGDRRASPDTESTGTSTRGNSPNGRNPESRHFSSGIFATSMKNTNLPGQAARKPLKALPRQMSVPAIIAPSTLSGRTPISPSGRRARFVDPRGRGSKKSLSMGPIRGRAEEDPLSHVTVDDVMNELQARGDDGPGSGESSPFAAAAAAAAPAKAAWMKNFVLSGKNLLVDKGKVIEKKQKIRVRGDEHEDDGEFWYHGDAKSSVDEADAAQKSSLLIQRGESGGRDALFNVEENLSRIPTDGSDDESLHRSKPKAELKTTEDAQPTQKQGGALAGKQRRRLSQNFFETETGFEKRRHSTTSATSATLADVADAAKFTFDSRVALRNISMQLRDDAVGNKASSRSPPLIKTVRALLGSDMSQSDIINLIFSEPSHIKKDINRALQQQAREDREKRSKKANTADKTTARWVHRNSTGPFDEDGLATKKTLGYGLNREIFEKCVKNFGETRGEQEANQFVIMRLFETVKEVYSHDDSRPSILRYQLV